MPKIVAYNPLTQSKLRIIMLCMITDSDVKKLLTEFKKVFATKDDLKRFATKDDLKRFATKKDLKSFATKEDLKGFATKDDLRNELRRYPTKDDLRNELKKYATKDDLKNELRNYPTKDDLRYELKKYATKDDLQNTTDEIVKLIVDGFSTVDDKLDNILQEIKTNRIVLGNHEDRLQRAERKIFS